MLSVYHMPGIVLGALHSASHLFLTMALWVGGIISIVQIKKLDQLTHLPSHEEKGCIPRSVTNCLVPSSVIYCPLTRN